MEKQFCRTPQNHLTEMDTLVVSRQSVATFGGAELVNTDAAEKAKSPGPEATSNKLSLKLQRGTRPRRLLPRRRA